ncbi:MAG: transketolase, partial [Armatimonadetes bacterium]|nr:transketolase [Armatimonadota bacterium]
AMATREASGKALNAIAPLVPALMGGSADLAPSTKTIIEGAGDFSAENPTGRNMHFGVREHAMGAIANGMALHGGLIPYVGTFLVFSDYMRPPIRLAAMMGLRVIYVFTHDSIGVGEDGPTHQPIEQLAALRAIPNLTVIRPSDAAETAQAWRAALLNKTGPTALILTRQKLPAVERAAGVGAEGLLRGAYVVWQSGAARPQILLLATGSEVAPAVEAARILAAEGIAARVVAMPSWQLFEAQTRKYRNSVLSPGVRARLAVEAGVRLGWDRYVGPRGDVICMTRFGASAPESVLMKQFGFSAENIAARARALLKR